MRPRDSAYETEYYSYVLSVVGENLRARRLLLVMTQRQATVLLFKALGRDAPTGTTYLRSIETGNSRLSLCRLLVIGDVFGMTPVEMFARVRTTSDYFKVPAYAQIQ